MMIARWHILMCAAVLVGALLFALSHSEHHSYDEALRRRNDFPAPALTHSLAPSPYTQKGEVHGAYLRQRQELLSEPQSSFAKPLLDLAQALLNASVTQPCVVPADATMRGWLPIQAQATTAHDVASTIYRDLFTNSTSTHTPWDSNHGKISAMWQSAAQHHRRRFVSAVERHREESKHPFCYYRVTNACIIGGQLTLFGPQASAFPNFRLCNELKQKVRFRFRVVPDAPVHPPYAVGATSSPRAHVAACWQYYGYHLVMCLASLFTLQLQHNWTNVDMLLYNHAVSLPEVSRLHFSHALFRGSNTSFDDPVPAVGAKPLPYWALWTQNTLHPRQIQEVQRAVFAESGPDRCYSQMLVGQPSHHALLPVHRRLHAMHLQHIMQKRTAQYANSTYALDHIEAENAAELFCRESSSSGEFFSSTFRVTIVDRRSGHMQGSRRILNRAAVFSKVVSILSSDASRGNAQRTGQTPHCEVHTPNLRFFSQRIAANQDGTDRRRLPQRVVVCLVDWALMDFADQFRVAHHTNLLIATHGGGNTWLTFMQPRVSAFIELWEAAYVPRNVFSALAEQLDVVYLPHLKSSVTEVGNFMHKNVEVDLRVLEHLVEQAVQQVREHAGECQRC